jgi:hypothetical protein
VEDKIFLVSIIQGLINNFKNMQEMFVFDAVSLKKIGTGALIAGSGAVLTYVAQNITALDFGASTPIVVAVLSILVNALREYIKGE